MPAEMSAIPSEPFATEALVVRREGKERTVACQPGETILESLRRAGLDPPFNCQAGNCGTCLAFVERGEARMRANNALDAEEVAEGWVLTCQAVPASPEVVVDYDRY